MVDEGVVQARCWAGLLSPKKVVVLLRHGRSGDRRAVAGLLENGVHDEAGAVGGGEAGEHRGVLLVRGPRDLRPGAQSMYGAQ